MFVNVLETLVTSATLASLFCASYLKTLLDDVVDVTEDGVCDIEVVMAVVTDPVLSAEVLPRFLLANSYMSPNIPAKVRRRFFIVSSVSSPTDD